MATAPHLADLQLTYASPERAEEYLAATMRGFHHEYDPEAYGPGRAVFEPDRFFGYTVDGRWVTTCGAYTRTMTVPGGTVPTAAVTYVSVQPSYRRRGLLRQMMRHQLEDIAARGVEPVALLWATEGGIYGRYGYGHATPLLKVSGSTPATAFRPGVDLGGGSVGEVDADEWRAVAAQVRDRLLPHRPGALDRSPQWWAAGTNDHPTRRGGASALRFALHYGADGEPDGYLSFRTQSAGHVFEPNVEVRVSSLDAETPAAYARLWRFALDLDLVRTFQAYVGLDDPLRHLVTDVAAVQAEVLEGTFVRLVDVPGALEARRYATEVDLVLGVRDPMLAQNDATFRLQGGPDGASVSRVATSPDLDLDVRDLGAVYLGGTSPETLRRAGLVQERTAGAARRLAAALVAPREPFCVDFF